MEKKIIDLTLEDLEKTCKKYPYCDKCPFARVDIDYLTCLKQELENNNCKSVKELVNKEIEV